MKVLNRLETKDLWQSAYMMAHGSSLFDVKAINNGSTSLTTGGKKEVFFVLSGENTARLAREFRSGRAVCNVASLRASMLHLKEEMYKIINV
jgi:hypothetical protein